MKPLSIIVLSSLLVITAVFSFPGAGGAAMWIGLQGGPNFVAAGDIKADLSGANIARIKYVKTEPSFLGGIVIGYDFINEGVLGRNWPDWMKYFSVALDVTYNNYTQPAQYVKAVMPFNPPRREVSIYIDQANGYMIQLSLFLIAKYGLFPTPEIPRGRLIPYVGVGPGLVFSVVDTSNSFFAYHSSDSAELAFFAEGGIRYMVFPKVSMDTAFRYRYVFPSYDRNYDTSIGRFYGVGRIIAQSFAAIFRVNYHF